MLRALIIFGLASQLACAAPPAPTPRVAPSPAARPVADTSCLPETVVPCPCKAGKGYRACESGALGECVCSHEAPGVTITAAGPPRASADPTATPADVAAPPSHAMRTSTGLAYVVLRGGPGGAHPGPRDTVTVHYAGWTTNGVLFDSSYKRGHTASFPLNRVIPGWTEGLQLMAIGDKFRFWIPASLAYKGRTGPPQGMLVFDIELLGFR